MSFEIDFGKIEKKWESLSFDEAKKKFIDDGKMFVNKMHKNSSILEELNMTSAVIIKNIMYFMREKEVLGSADVFYFGTFEKCAGSSESLFQGNPTVNTLKFSKIMSSTSMVTDGISSLYNDEFFVHSGIIMGADFIYPLPFSFSESDKEPVYLLYNITFVNKNVDTALLQHYGYITSKTECVFCGHQNKTKKCLGCECVFYCSVDCQKMHWKIHKKYCKKVHAFDKNCEHCLYTKNKTFKQVN